MCRSDLFSFRSQLARLVKDETTGWFHWLRSVLYWVLTHWVHFTVHSLDLVVCICVFCAFVFHTAYCVIVSTVGGPSGIEAWSLGLLFLQYFDTVGWVFWPIKPVPDMTYNVFGGTLNLAQLNSVLTAPLQCFDAAGYLRYGLLKLEFFLSDRGRKSY